MLDRTDLQLMLCEQLVELDTEELMEIIGRLTKSTLEMEDPEEETIIGGLAIGDPAFLKKMLGFWLDALGERIAIPQPAEQEESYPSEEKTAGKING